MLKPLPTYEQCLDLTSNNCAFYETKYVIDGYNISVFNYRLAKYHDFAHDSINAFELRGITFVFDKDGTYNRFILLNKFFNINQVETTLYSNIKNYKVKYVSNKEDGSVASFIKLPNNKVIGKTKMGFDNHQAIAINKIYNTDDNIKNFVDHCLDNNISAIFEYVSPDNRIVLKYLQKELILLKLRNNLTGEYIDISKFDKIENIKVADFENYNLDELLSLAKTTINKEGWIIQFENDMLVKIKTDWYFSLHGLLTEDIYREDVIIHNILNDTIDDMLSQIPSDEIDIRLKIDEIVNIIQKEINNIKENIINLYQEYNKINDRKEFSLKYYKDPYFQCVVLYIDGIELKKLSEEEAKSKYKDIIKYYDSLKKRDLYEIIKNYIIKSTDKLEKARTWLTK
jgi:T4 RnlA family RNA ligase